MATLTVLCGLSFAGKSTLADRLSRALPAEIVSLDTINSERGLDGGQGIPIEEWAQTSRIAHDRAAASLREGTEVIVDDTGSLRFLRDEWRATARDVGAAFVLVWVDIDPDLQRRRVAQNRRSAERPDVVDRVLESHLAAFEAPSPDEHPILVPASETHDDARIATLVDDIRSR